MVQTQTVLNTADNSAQRKSCVLRFWVIPEEDMHV